MLSLSSGANLTPFLLDSPASTGVLVLPGGGYWTHACDHEGCEVASWLNARGFDAWMLEYRIAPGTHPQPLYPAPLDDAREAVKTIRETNRVQKLGIWGFSAGGHLAMLTATEADHALDFQILAYPVVSMEKAWTHKGSRGGLLGDNLDWELAKQLSGENRVSRATPPAFLFHTQDDPAVTVENVLSYALALREYSIPFELHIHENGRHGVGLALGDANLNSWSERLHDWLNRRKSD